MTSTEKVAARLQNLCARQECCSKDIYEKALRRLEGDAEAAADVLRRLQEDEFVDDLRYARAFCREKSSLTGWGPHKIRFALKSKGIADELISAALSEIDAESSSDKLSRLLASKARSLEGDPQARLKLIRFALGRGYDYPQVEKALADISVPASDDAT